MSDAVIPRKVGTECSILGTLHVVEVNYRSRTSEYMDANWDEEVAGRVRVIRPTSTLFLQQHLIRAEQSSCR